MGIYRRVFLSFRAIVAKRYKKFKKYIPLGALPSFILIAELYFCNRGRLRRRRKWKTERGRLGAERREKGKGKRK
jgi:hypothetical protein